MLQQCVEHPWLLTTGMRARGGQETGSSLGLGGGGGGATAGEDKGVKLQDAGKGRGE